MSTASLIALSAQATRCVSCIWFASSPRRSRSSSGSPKMLKPSLPSIQLILGGRKRNSLPPVALPVPSPKATALITGASAGIGEAIARELAGRGHGVTLVARREDRLRTLAGELSDRFGVRAEALSADLADKAAREDLSRRIPELGLDVEILVNNAGFGG